MPLDAPSADGADGLAGVPGRDPPAPGQAAGQSGVSGYDLVADPRPAGSPAPDSNLTAPRPARPDRARPDLVPWLIATAVFAAYTAISVFRYLRRDPTSWDLGIFTEYVKRLAHLQAPIVDIRGTGVNLLGDHFHPIVALIAPFFRIFPTPVTLLVAQALLAAVSVLPVYRAGTDLLGSAAGRVIAVCYGFSWGLQQLVSYDFHEIAFAVPLLACSLSALIRGRMRAAAAWALPLVFVKEDQGFTLVAIGLILVFAYRQRGLGFFLAGWGLFWSLLAILVIIPHFNAQHVYAYWSMGGATSSAGGHFSLGGIWTSLRTGAVTKLSTLAMILLVTAFVAVRSPVLLAALPGLALRFVSSNSAFWGTSWHYNATVMPIVCIAAIDALARIRAGRPVRLRLAVGRYVPVAMLAAGAVLAFRFPLNSLRSPATFQLGPHVAAENQAMSLVPYGSTVGTGLDLLAPLAARADTFWLGNYGTNPPAQYVIVDALRSDWYPPPANVPFFVEQITKGTRYRQIYLKDGVYVFRRAG